MSDLDTALAGTEPATETARSVVRSDRKCRRHQWVKAAYELSETWFCDRCGVVRDVTRSRRGKSSRDYGNRAELKVARTYGGTKVGHHGGPVDVRGKDFDTQVRTKRRQPPPEWTTALNAMTGGTRCPRMLIRYVRPGAPPEDFFVFRAKDFLDWFGRDEELSDVG